MGRTSSIATLPKEVQHELNERLRAGAYGGLVELAGWLREKGHFVGKSSIHRHSQALRVADLEAGSYEAAILAARRDSMVSNADLLEEVKRLRDQIDALTALIKAGHPAIYPAS